MVTKKLLIVDPKKIKWEPVEDAANGVRVKLLWTDKKTRARAGVEHSNPSIDHAPEGCVAFIYFNGPPRQPVHACKVIP